MNRKRIWTVDADHVSISEGRRTGSDIFPDDGAYHPYLLVTNCKKIADVDAQKLRDAGLLLPSHVSEYSEFIWLKEDCYDDDFILVTSVVQQ
jgi:hypothetical protein